MALVHLQQDVRQLQHPELHRHSLPKRRLLGRNWWLLLSHRAHRTYHDFHCFRIIPHWKMRGRLVHGFFPVSGPSHFINTGRMTPTLLRVCDNGHVCPIGQYYCAGKCYSPSSQCCSNGALTSSSGACLCNGQGFGGTAYACDNNQLCPAGTYACGGACYSPSCTFMTFCEALTLISDIFLSDSLWLLQWRSDCRGPRLLSYRVASTIKPLVVVSIGLDYPNTSFIYPQLEA